jgi:hypothetical protein
MGFKIKTQNTDIPKDDNRTYFYVSGAEHKVDKKGIILKLR